jgi:hypothetical protein
MQNYTDVYPTEENTGKNYKFKTDCTGKGDYFSIVAF